MTEVTAEITRIDSADFSGLKVSAPSPCAAEYLTAAAAAADQSGVS